MTQSLLLVGPNAHAVDPMTTHLARRGYLMHFAEAGEEALRIHREDGVDLVLITLPLADLTGDLLLKRLRLQDSRVVAIVAGRDAVIHGAPEALELGAFDYLSDPWRDLDQLLNLVGISLGARNSDAQLRYLRKKDAAGADWQTIVGQCSAMRQVFATVRQICHRTSAGATPSILLTGETGTGKGLIAKAIHYNSVRRSRGFVDVNCAALPPSLVETELFGHAKGAFTDAKVARAGLFETANGGTLFLDEISALPLLLQGKLLTAIEEKTIRRVGSSAPVEIDVQIVAASNRDLNRMVTEHQFRADLFHRLNVVAIRLPPLRERGEDLFLMAEAFVAATCREYGIAEKHLSTGARAAIAAYGWPGNVRELKNQIERIVLLENEEEIPARAFGSGGASVRIDRAGDRLRVSLPEAACPLDDLEREVIRQALAKYAGNVSRAARYLDITRHTLIYRMKRHGLADRDEDLTLDRARSHH